jgi:biopolymer transport protein TolQ
MNLLLTVPFFQAYTQSDLFGKMIFISLFILSITSWVLIVHKIFLVRKLKKHSFVFEKDIEKKEDSLLSFKFDGLTLLQHPYLEIFSCLKNKTLEILNKNRFYLNNQITPKEVSLAPEDMELIESHVDATILHVAKKLEKNLFILSTVVTLAPFLGLLGTVWGILLTFSNLQSHAITTGNTSILSGLSLALGTTVIGLVVAIPALVAYNYLKATVKDFTVDMENFSHRLLAKIEIQYRRVNLD